MGMSRLIAVVLAVSALFAAGAPAVRAAGSEEDMTRQAAMATRFAPFDNVTGTEWQPAFPFPSFRNAAVGEVDSSPVTLQTGAYRVVVLCNCTKMEVALFLPDGKEALADRTNDQAAMYAIDAPAPGQFVVGVQMQDCPEDACDYAFKVYKKTN